MEDRHEAALELIERETESLIRTIEAIRLLQTSTNPHAASLDKSPKWVQAMSDARMSLPAAKRETFDATIAVATPFVLGLANGVIGTTKKRHDDLDDADWAGVPPEHLIPAEIRDRVLGKSRVTASIKKKADFRLIEHDGRYRVEIDDQQILLQFWRVASEVENWSSSPNHLELLHRSFLIMAVSTYEVFVSSVYRSFLMRHYRAADDADVKRFSLSDLMTFGTMEDAVDETIHQLADSFSRKGVRTWAKWFAGKPLNLDLAAMSIDWERTVEVFERRNLDGMRVEAGASLA